ncbi:MAG: cytochrome c [Pseudomonadota bacterium]
MKRYIGVVLIVGILAVAAYTLFTLYDTRFPFGRMWETPAIRPHEEAITYMAAGSVPFSGGEASYRDREGKDILSPISGPEMADATAIGEKLYVQFCIQCHGKYHDGNGTVGQSFAPLPGDLRSLKVQTLADGVIFKEISYGIPGGRQPPLASTIEVQDRWRVIAFVKSLGVRP